MKPGATILLLLILVLRAAPSDGQIRFGGLADFEIRKGGGDSDPTVNQTPNSNWLVFTPMIRLFVTGSISGRWYISGALQSDYYDGRRSDLFVSSFNINWQPTDRFRFTAGRFTTPYGRYEDLLLSSDNPFVHMPLSHVWNMPVDRKQGYVFSGTSYDGIAGMSMVYQRLYSQGLMISGNNSHETIHYQLAAAMTTVSGYTDVGQQARPALIGRVVVRPVFWNRTGVSFSNGPYMVDDPVNDVLPDKRRGEYLQNIVTAYTEFTYRYYQLLLQYSFNRWDSPWINSAGELVQDNMDNDVTHMLARYKVRFPFFPGMYGAVRYERFLPGELTLESMGITGKPTPDKERVEVVLGYRPERNLLLKISYLFSGNSGTDIDDDVFAIQLSAGF